MNLLITGGAGFIGSNLARVAAKQGLDVTILDDLSTGSNANLTGLDVRLVEGSILDVAAVDEALRGVSSVVHLAALPSVPRSISDPLGTHTANATGTLVLLEGCRRHGVDHVVAGSSSSVYGLNPAAEKHEREWIRPMSPYAVSKLAAEQYVLAYQESFSMRTLAFRFFNVYGPGQPAGHAYAAVLPAFIDAILGGRPVPLHGDGLQTRDFTYVGTVCNVLLKAAVGRVSHKEPVNLAFGTNTSLLSLLQMLRDQTGIAFEIQHLPPRAGDVKHSRAANGSLLSLFPETQPISLEEGVRATVDWFRRSR